MSYADPIKQREFNRKWIAARRKAFFEGKSCVVCGSVKSLELDHIDPGQKISHRIWSWREERRTSEIAKCQVLCRSCHLAKTREWRKAQRKHGRTLYGYGCRCDICCAAQQLHNRRYYERKKRERSGQPLAAAA